MNEGNELKIECMFQSKTYGAVACLIRIVDEGSVAKLSDVRLAKDMYLMEKKLGNNNISLQERLSCLIEKYPGKKKEEIAKEIIEKLQAHNAQIRKQNDK